MKNYYLFPYSIFNCAFNRLLLEFTYIPTEHLFQSIVKQFFFRRHSSGIYFSFVTLFYKTVSISLNKRHRPVTIVVRKTLLSMLRSSISRSKTSSSLSNSCRWFLHIFIINCSLNTLSLFLLLCGTRLILHRFHLQYSGSWSTWLL